MDMTYICPLTGKVKVSCVLIWTGTFCWRVLRWLFTRSACAVRGGGEWCSPHCRWWRCELLRRRTLAPSTSIAAATDPLAVSDSRHRPQGKKNKPSGKENKKLPVNTVLRPFPSQFQGFSEQRDLQQNRFKEQRKESGRQFSPLFSKISFQSRKRLVIYHSCQRSWTWPHDRSSTGLLRAFPSTFFFSREKHIGFIKGKGKGTRKLDLNDSWLHFSLIANWTWRSRWLVGKLLTVPQHRLTKVLLHHVSFSFGKKTWKHGDLC